MLKKARAFWWKHWWEKPSKVGDPWEDLPNINQQIVFITCVTTGIIIFEMSSKIRQQHFGWNSIILVFWLIQGNRSRIWHTISIRRILSMKHSMWHRWISDNKHLKQWHRFGPATFFNSHTHLRLCRFPIMKHHYAADVLVVSVAIVAVVCCLQRNITVEN